VEFQTSTIRTTPNGDDVRRRVLDAAEALFAERGYAAATTRDIAQRAGIQKRMVFYYFPRKDALYRAVLERVIAGMVAIHEQFRDDPGPTGLAEAVDGVVAFASQRLPAVKLLLREIIDDGPHLPDLAREHLRPLFARGAAEVERNVANGVFHPGDPMHVLVSVGGLSLFYFLMVPLLRLVWERDPLAPETVIERAAAVRALLLRGLMGSAIDDGGDAQCSDGSLAG
jgi:AcrR family transcriptional regulator